MNSNNVVSISGSTANGTLVVDNGSIAGSSTCISYPYYYPYTTITYPSYVVQDYDIKIRKVENGYILLKDGKEFILSKPEEIVKYLKEK